MRTPLRAATLLTTHFILPVTAQETRSAIFGRVSEAQGAAVPDATLEVTNTGTNVAIAVQANETGYFEANLLIASA